MKTDAIRQYVALKKALTAEKIEIESRLREIGAALDGSLPQAPLLDMAEAPRKAAGVIRRKPGRRARSARLRAKAASEKTAPSKPAPQAAKPAKPVSSAGKAVRGERTEKIINALQSAGKTGLSVKELAAQLGTKYRNVNVWIHSTGKKVTGIKKVSPGRVAWVG